MPKKKTPQPAGTFFGTRTERYIMSASVVTSVTSTTSTTSTSVTPYAAHKIVNLALLEAGIIKVIPPQMMYNYTSGRINKGKAPYITCDASGRITLEGLTEWIAKYLLKQGVKVAGPADEPATIDWDGNPVVRETEEVLVTEEV